MSERRSGQCVPNSHPVACPTFGPVTPAAEVLSDWTRNSTASLPFSFHPNPAWNSAFLSVAPDHLTAKKTPSGQQKRMNRMEL